MSETQTVRLGRTDYGWGVTATLVEVEGTLFAQRGDNLYSACGKCGDWSGTLPHYMGIYGGVCFDCNGRGWRGGPYTPAKARALVKSRAAAARRRERKEADRLAAMEVERVQWHATHPEVVAILDEVAKDLPSSDLYRSDFDAYFDANRVAVAKWGQALVDYAAYYGTRALDASETAAVAPAYERATAKAAAAAAKAEVARYTGTVGAKVTGRGKIVVRHYYETYYGGPAKGNLMLVIEGTGDDAGVTFKVAGAGQTLWETERGDEVEVTGTVKDHSEYEGTPQTVLTRAKVTVLSPSAS